MPDVSLSDSASDIEPSPPRERAEPQQTTARSHQQEESRQEQRPEEEKKKKRRRKKKSFENETATKQEGQPIADQSRDIPSKRGRKRSAVAETDRHSKRGSKRSAVAETDRHSKRGRERSVAETHRHSKRWRRLTQQGSRSRPVNIFGSRVPHPPPPPPPLPPPPPPPPPSSGNAQSTHQHQEAEPRDAAPSERRRGHSKRERERSAVAETDELFPRAAELDRVLARRSAARASEGLVEGCRSKARPPPAPVDKKTQKVLRRPALAAHAAPYAQEPT